MKIRSLLFLCMVVSGCAHHEPTLTYPNQSFETKVQEKKSEAKVTIVQTSDSISETFSEKVDKAYEWTFSEQHKADLKKAYEKTKAATKEAVGNGFVKVGEAIKEL